MKSEEESSNALFVSALEALIATKREKPPLMRSIHHFTCSGGTIISKCIAAMPNVCLLSEVDPLSAMGFDSARPHFAPTDVIRHLRFSPRCIEDEVVVNCYLAQIKSLAIDLNKRGMSLVLRDHSHSNYCVERAADSRVSHIEILRRHFDSCAIITVRDPVESYGSLLGNRWETYAPRGFDEYCRRYLDFLDEHRTLPVYKYEDFTADPESILMQMCSNLALDYNDVWQSTVSIFSLTGDSGRASDEVSHRTRKPVSDDLARQIEVSRNWEKLSDRLGYSSSLSENRSR